MLLPSATLLRGRTPPCMYASHPPPSKHPGSGGAVRCCDDAPARFAPRPACRCINQAAREEARTRSPPETTHITLRYSSTYVWQERGKDGGSGLGMPYSVHMPGTQVSPRETFMAQPTALHPPWILPPSPLFPIPQFPLDQTKAVSTIGTPSFPLPLVNAHHAHAWPIRLQTPPLPNNLACFIPIACALPPNASLVSLF